MYRFNLRLVIEENKQTAIYLFIIIFIDFDLYIYSLKKGFFVKLTSDFFLFFFLEK